MFLGKTKKNHKFAFSFNNGSVHICVYMFNRRRNKSSKQTKEVYFFIFNSLIETGMDANIHLMCLNLHILKKNKQSFLIKYATFKISEHTVCGHYRVLRVYVFNSCTYIFLQTILNMKYQNLRFRFSMLFAICQSVAVKM